LHLTEAGRIQKEHYHKAHIIDQKESISSIVTEVDLMCDKAITEVIIRDFPGHNILTEESGFQNNKSEYTWVVDPLDGTSNFAAGIPWFGVLIALFYKDTPILAGAILPVENLMYIAEAEKGAYVNDIKIVIPDNTLVNSLAGFGIDFTHDNSFLELGMDWFRWLIKNSRNVRCTNSLVDWMLVTEGKLGVAVNLFTKIWDIAAPWLIIKEAGGMMKHLDGTNIIFELTEEAIYKNYPVIAGNLSILNEIEIQKRI
ncbi:MAG: inositol monophosphatase, partial [Bacteroidales bacterium]|nr:inositol monophosphatase [Bacteroidales bacterium]